MQSFGSSIAAKAAGETPVGAAIGVNHQDNAPGPVQVHRFANLLQHEFTLCLEFGRSQAFGATGNLDGVGIVNANALQEFAECQVKPVVETPKNGGVALIPLPRTFEIKYLFHDAASAFALRCFSQASCSDFPQCAISIL